MNQQKAACVVDGKAELEEHVRAALGRAAKPPFEKCIERVPRDTAP